jgi:hypothetical protein
MNDLSFLSEVEGAVVEMPLAIQGLVSGRAQLAQRVITMLLSSPDDPLRTFSTGILNTVGQSNVRNAADLENDFTLATKEARQVIENEQAVRTDLTDDETLSDVTAENIKVDGDKVYADIVIITVSGEDLKVSLEI